MPEVNAIPVLDSSTQQWDLAMDTVFDPAVVEAYQSAVILFDQQYPGIKKSNDKDGYQGAFVQKAPNPEPDEVYTPGNLLVGQQYGNREDFITLDEPLVTHDWFRFDHVEVSRFPIIEPNVIGMGEALGRKLDKRGFITLAKAARSGSVYDSQGSTNGLTIHSGGNRVFRNTAGTEAQAYPTSDTTGAAAFRDDADDLCKLMDEDNIPREGRILYITPRINRVMQKDTGIFDVRYAQNQSANNVQKAVLGEMAGFKILMVNGRIPQTNITSANNTPAKYTGNFSIQSLAGTGNGMPVAIAVAGVRQGSAPVGFRQVGPIRIEKKWVGERMSWFCSAAILGGFGQMHQYCAGSIEVTTT